MVVLIKNTLYIFFFKLYSRIRKRDILNTNFNFRIRVFLSNAQFRFVGETKSVAFNNSVLTENVAHVALGETRCEITNGKTRNTIQTRLSQPRLVRIRISTSKSQTGFPRTLSVYLIPNNFPYHALTSINSLAKSNDRRWSSLARQCLRSFSRAEWSLTTLVPFQSVCIFFFFLLQPICKEKGNFEPITR